MLGVIIFLFPANSSLLFSTLHFRVVLTRFNIICGSVVI